MKLLGSIAVAIGLATAGWFVRDGIITFRKMDQVIEVRGLDERVVNANEGSLNIGFQVSGGSIKELSGEIAVAQKSAEEFLTAHSIPAASIQKVAVTITDNLQNGGAKELSTTARYTGRAGVVVFSNDITQIQGLAQSTEELISKGVVLESTSPKFTFTDLNSVKPKMLIAATQSAREAAESFSRDSGAKLGGIKSATQGLFTISSPGGDYDEPSSVQKKVRVVTRVSYYVE